MKINPRSLRVRLFMLYLGLVLFSMICLGAFSYWYLSGALASARERTMVAREERIVAYINSWPAKDTSLTMAEKLRQLSIGIAETDIIQLYALDGSPIYATPGHDELKLPWPDASCVVRCMALARMDGHAIRVLNHVVELDGRRARLSLSGTIDEHSNILQVARNSYLLFCPLLILVSAAGGYWLSRRALVPVGRMTAEARTIGIQDMTRRLPVPDTGDELQALAESWNELLGRLESAVAKLTQFTGDISHDLNTTITVMLTTAELALAKQRDAVQYRDALSAIAADCEATSHLLEDLLTVARADMLPEISSDPIELSALVADVCDQFSGRAQWKNLRVEQQIEQNLWVSGDGSLLRRMTGILLDNAIKYTPEGGSIRLTLSLEGECIELLVSDTGVGIAAEDIERIFDRFYRADKSRSEESTGNGLGLSIAKWIAETHDSVISVQSTPSQGSAFRVSLPPLSIDMSIPGRAASRLQSTSPTGRWS